MERGTLVRWNNEKGFGFIKPETGNNQDVFIHISTLKHMARKPIVGDEILFHRENQPDGKVKAVKASIEGVAVVSNTTRSASHTDQRHRNSQPHRYDNHRSSSLISRLILLVSIIGIGIFGYKQYQKMTATPVLTNEDVEQMQWIEPTPSFSCEAGKTHCSQMTSCAEATFYINNCPGTKMDGNNDGVPCERQFCN
ncbi:excalibur calcium-binding domain-containing protein [Shewanella polaris]|nr:excalibur calcium-binding domain-containing protein [Shewanella polaris]